MADFISREAAIKAVDEIDTWSAGWRYKHIKRLTDIPAADVVEVVRCKDCVHNCGEGFVGGTISCGLINLFTVGKDPMDFCSSGERRADNGNQLYQLPRCGADMTQEPRKKESPDEPRLAAN